MPKQHQLPILVVDKEIVQVGLGRIFKPEVMPVRQLYIYSPGTAYVPLGNSSKHYLKLLYGKDTFVEIVSKIENVDHNEVYLRIRGSQKLIPDYFLKFYKDCFLEHCVYKTVPFSTYQDAKKHVKQLLDI